MSWSFVPSLIGFMLLMFGVVSTTEGDSTRGVVHLVLGTAFLALCVWMVKRESRR
jgi:hypothetical protein